MGANVRRTRDPNSRIVARIPEEPLGERVLDLAAPLLARLGTDPTPDAIRDVIETVVAFWNAKAQDSKVWGPSRPKQLNDLKHRMTGKKAAAEDAEAFKLLSGRWIAKDLAFDPRLVGDWSLEVGGLAGLHLACVTELPDGVEAHVPPPIGKRVAIGGKFLDEMGIRVSWMPGTISLLSFPIEHHQGAVGDDGSVIVRTKIQTAVALFAEGVLPSINGGTVRLMVQGKEIDGMVLTEIRCEPNGGHNDIAVLVFKARIG